MKMRSVTICLLVMTVLAVAAGCAKKPPPPQGVVDVAPAHTSLGFKLIDQGKYEAALGEFDLALRTEPKYSLAHSGKATALALMGKGDDAVKSLGEAKKYAETPDEKTELGAAIIRVHTALKDKNWLSECEDAFDDYKKDAAKTRYAARLHALMGQAYMEADCQLKKAKDVLTEGSKLDADYPSVNELLKMVATAETALAGMPDQYCKIATAQTVTRADVAAIFVAELKLDKLLDTRGAFDKTKGFETPEGRASSTVRTGAALGITDIGGHWAAEFIEKMVDQGVMEVVDYKFDPDKKITKAEFALLLDSIVTRVTGENPAKGIDVQIFRDIPPMHYLSAASITVTTRGFLEARLDGTFGIQDPVPGATALGAVRKVRDYFQNAFNYRW